MTNEILNTIILIGELHKHKYLKTTNNNIELYSSVNRINVQIIKEKEFRVKYNFFDETKIVELSNFTIYDFLEKLLMRTDRIMIEPKVAELIGIVEWKNQLKPSLIKLETEKNYNHYLKHSKIKSSRFEIEYFDNIVVIRDTENKILTNALTLKNALQQWL